jgi:ATP-binding cassette subfamily C protein
MTALFFEFIRKLGSRYRGKLAVLFLMTIVTGILEAIGILFIFPLIILVQNPAIVTGGGRMNAVYDFFGFSSPESMILTIALLIGATFIIKNIYMIYFQYKEMNIVRQWRNEICEAMMRKYLSSPFKFHLERSSAHMINMLTSTVMMALNGFIFSVIMLFANTIVAMMLLALLLVKFFIPTLISAAVLIILTVIQARTVRNYTMEINQEVNKANAKNLSVLTQAINAIRETKVFRREDYFTRTYSKSNSKISYYDGKSMLIQFIPTYVSEIVLVITIIIMCCLVLLDSYTPAGGIASLGILAGVAFRLAPMINRSLFCYSQIRVSSGATRELLDEIDKLETYDVESFDLPDEELGFKDRLTLDKVGFSYKDGSPVLIDINLQVKKGEFIGIVGPSGAGKTTLVDILLGLLMRHQGEYKVDDTLITTKNVRALRQLAGYVNQSPYIFDASVRENIAFGIDESEIDDARVTECLKMASLYDFFKDKENFLEEPLGDLGKNLSGGQKQRIAIARALYNNPEIIVLDEATSALDVETEHGITQVINRLKGEKTVIAIAHRLSTLKECDRIVYMDAGSIVDVGSFKELQAKHANFSRMLELSSIRTD